MATVFATNVNVFTADEVSPLRHRVVSWAWRDPAQSVERQRDSMIEATRRDLRRFPNADEVARAYHANKVMLAPGRLGLLRAIAWAAGAVRRSDRVLVAAPLGGPDRILWVTAYVAAKLFRRPILLYSETWIEPEGLRWFAEKWLRRRLRADAFRVLVPSAVHRDFHVAAGVAAERLCEIRSIYCPRGEPCELLAVRHKAARGRPFTFLYIGRLVPYKGLLRLLDLLPRVRAVEPSRLIVVAARAAQHMGSEGDYADRCHRRAAGLPAGAVELRDHTDDVESVYAEVDALVMPNVVVARDKVPAEAWGRVVEEALHHGVPVISTDSVPAAVELVREGVNGHVLPWEDDARLEAALVAVASRGRYDAARSGTAGATG